MSDVREEVPLWRGLLSGALGPRALAPRRGADEAGRLQRRAGGGVRLVLLRAARGRVRLRLARRGHGRPRPAGHQRHRRHADGHRAALDGPQVSRGHADARQRPAGQVRHAQGLLRAEPGLRPARHARRRAGRAPLRCRRARDRVPDRQRVRRLAAASARSACRRSKISSGTATARSNGSTRSGAPGSGAWCSTTSPRCPGRPTRRARPSTWTRGGSGAAWTWTTSPSRSPCCAVSPRASRSRTTSWGCTPGSTTTTWRANSTSRPGTTTPATTRRPATPPTRWRTPSCARPSAPTSWSWSSSPARAAG